MNVPRLIALTLVLTAAPSFATAQTITDCKGLLAAGEYEDCLQATTRAVNRRSYGEDWPLMKAQAEYHLGRYLDAQKSLQAGVQRYAWSIRLRMKQYRLAKMSGDREQALRLLDEIGQLASDSPWRYTDADDLVALGEASIEMGADPKDVLEGFYNRARRNYRSRPDGFLAAAQLALDKGDKQLAVDILSPVLDQFADNAAITYTFAEAIGSLDPERARDLTAQTLQQNPRFTPALLQQVSRMIDAESYDAAEALIAEMLQTNPWQPEAHAYQAVIHHLQNRPVQEAESRALGMSIFGSNPDVDHLIGRTLSRRYRFREGAAYQRRALAADSFHLAARTQLAQDLLRLGQDEEGWQLADAAQLQDKYSATLFNLMQLRSSLDRFATIRNDHFIIRMDRTEAAVYGPRLESLLNRAFATLSEKYGYTPDEPVVVEVFDQPSDFAVRTFGIPDVAGFLGVCFGQLITANSPASQRQNPNNWEAVLWHEFCHVITLQMTGNRIPRWLSEGISVYEERQADSRWGQRMTPGYRERILAGRVTPVSQLSSAFLNAGSGEDLNFAYYESSMVVEFIVRRFGFQALTDILADLNGGLRINDALDRHTGGIENLDREFAADLKQRAADFAPGVEFTLAGDDGPLPSIAIPAAPTKNYSVALMMVVQQLERQEYDGAEARLRELIDWFPQDESRNSARKLLARLYADLDRPADQMAVLAEHVQRTADDIDAVTTLLALQVSSKQWEAAAETGELALAIDPLQPALLRSLLQVAEATGRTADSLPLLNGLLELDTANAARWHFLLAQAYRDSQPQLARRHVLLSLEQAPRYRDAHQLLLKLTDADSAADNRPGDEPPGSN
ncbi:MAG: peptidase MA family metallohydrolase [Planctomycetaceae bacterium]|nr:peptidase MA family metallohydrolase [Planctomycetaceae bacterium]